MKKINTNVETYNYLNIVCRRLGKLYKMTGYSPLPKDFDVNKEKFKELLILGQMKREDNFPPFAYDDKKQYKKFLKNSIKNCKKIIKTDFYKDFSTPKFAKNLALYFEIRLAVSEAILKDLRFHDFDEVAAYREIYNLNPVLGEFMDTLFEDKVDFANLFDDLERKYRASYLDKVQRLEKKTNDAAAKIQEEKNVQQSREILQEDEKSKFLGKMAEKNAKNAKKIAKKQEIRSVKEKIKKSKSQPVENKIKE